MSKIRLVNKNYKLEDLELKLNYKTFKKALGGEKEAIEYIKNKPIPNDFDWKFYLHSNKNLIKAGMNSEIEAIYHYLTQGEKRNAQYSRDKTEKWIFPDDYQKILRLQKLTNCCFVGGFVDFLFLSHSEDFCVMKDIDIICKTEPKNIPNLQFSKVERNSDLKFFLDLHHHKPDYLLEGTFENKTIDIFIKRNNMNIDSFNFKLNNDEINIVTVQDRIKSLESFLNNKDKLSNLNENWLVDKLNTVPEILSKLRKIEQNAK